MIEYTKKFSLNKKSSEFKLPKYAGALAGTTVSIAPNLIPQLGGVMGDLSTVNLRKRLKDKHPDWSQDKIESEYWKSRYKRRTSGEMIGLAGQTAVLATSGHVGQKKLTKLINSDKKYKSYATLAKGALKTVGKAGQVYYNIKDKFKK